MEKVITTSLIIIASLVAAMALINAVLPALGKSSGALTTANSEAAKRIKTDITVIHSTGDTSTNKVTIWVKNVGVQGIKKVEDSDIILTKPSGSVTRFSYTSGCTSECWDFSLEDNASNWTTAVTVKFTISTAVASGSYSISVAAPNGVSADKDFSV